MQHLFFAVDVWQKNNPSFSGYVKKAFIENTEMFGVFPE
jgi:hypothetical protein